MGAAALHRLVIEVGFLLIIDGCRNSCESFGVVDPGYRISTYGNAQVVVTELTECLILLLRLGRQHDISHTTGNIEQLQRHAC